MKADGLMSSFQEEEKQVFKKNVFINCKNAPAPEFFAW